MPGVFTLLLTIVLQSAGPVCADAPACRSAALAAAVAGDYETFHDLAWRAAQKGKPNDPEAMYLLARAQSLSGRPGDALVMLRRLAQLGIRTEAGTSDDFQRVRALPGWAELEALLANAETGGILRSEGPAAPPTPAPPPAPAPAASASPAAVARKTSPAAAAAALAPAAESALFAAEEAMPLSSVNIDPVALAYDSASRRFVLGDRRDNKLIVADAVFNHVNDLIGAASAGFGTLSALDIDDRRGDLWVTSNDGNGGAALHKLQLVSGRVLARLDVPAALQPVEISDLAVAPGGALLLLDRRGGRLITYQPSTGQFAEPVHLRLDSPTSMAAAAHGTYVAHREGLALLHVQTGRVTNVPASGDAVITELGRIRWTRGTLLGIQQSGDARRIVRLHVGRRGGVTSVQHLDGAALSAGTALAIARDGAYYVSTEADRPAIRRIRIP